MLALIYRRRRATVPPYLQFTTQPGGATSGSAFSPQPVVTAKNPDGSTNTSFTGNVTLAVNTVTGSHALGGTVTVAAVAGVATFSGVTDTGSGDGTLTATAAGYSSATSASFTTAAALVTRTDNFNRVDSTAGFGSPSDGGSAYTQRAGHGGISSNQGVPVASDSTGAGVAFNTNFTVCCETLACSLNGTFDLVLATRDAAIVQGIAFRCSDNSNFWVAAVRANLVYVYKVAGGVLTKLFDGVGSSNTLADGMTLRVVMTATGFEVWTVVGASSVKEYTSVDTFNSTGSAVHCGPFFGGDTTPRVDSLSFVGA